MTDELKEELAGQKKVKIRKRLRISVSQEEISEAVLGRTDKCMIHQAIKKAFPEFERISVDKNQIRFTDPDANVIYTFPMSPYGRAQILMWDAGEEINPFDLWLRNPVIRERKVGSDGYMKPEGVTDSSRANGPVRRPRTKEARAMSGRDRIHGQKLWTDELKKLRESLLPGQHRGGRGAVCTEPVSSIDTEASS